MKSTRESYREDVQTSIRKPIRASGERTGGLPLEMVRRLATGLKLPAEILIRGCELQRAA